MVATLILLCGVLPALAQERLDLPRAINYALSQNQELARAALSIDVETHGKADAHTAFDFTVSPDVMTSFTGVQHFARYAPRISKKWGSGAELTTSIGALSSLQSDVVHTRPSIRIQVQQPLFRNFGSLIHGEAVRKATSALLTERRKFEQRKADLVLEVVKTYESLLRFTQQVRADHASYERNDALHRVSKAKEGFGKTTRIDTLRVELLRGQASARLESSQEHLASTQREFAELLGFTPKTVFELAPSPRMELSLPQPEEAVKLALDNRLDYAQVLQDHADALRAVDIAGQQLWPDVQAQASYDDFATGSTAFGAIPLNAKIFYFGLSSPTTFNLPRQRIALGRAKLSQASAFQAIAITERSIAREVIQSRGALARAQAELEFAKRNVVLAEARAKLAQRLFQLGRGDHFAVTDAEESFFQAESQLFSAQAEASITGYQLLRALGTIVEVPQDLKPIRSFRSQ